MGLIYWTPFLNLYNLTPQMTTSESFFEALKTHRESQKIEIQDICEFTKIHRRYIQAIESGDFTVLPNVYMRLFLRSYAEFIGADSAKALEDYELHSTGKVQKKTEIEVPLAAEKKPDGEKTNLELDKDYQITPKRLLTIAAVLATLFLVFQLANKVTQEQVREIEGTSVKTPVSVTPEPDLLLADDELTQPDSLARGDNFLEEKPTGVEKNAVMPLNRVPLNKNDFTLEKKIREVTETVHLSPPYTITIHTLSETKLNLSKYSNGELTALINDVVESGEMYSFVFDSTLNFELWSCRQVKVSLNNTPIDNYLGKDDLAVRGSFEVGPNQLYLGFYRH